MKRESRQEVPVKTMLNRARKQRGFALMYSAIILTVLTVFCGLAIDATILFLVRSKLSSAVDAAALAGARSVNLGTSQAAANIAATSTAQSFFLANFPNGFLGSQALDMTNNFSATFNQNVTTGLLTVAVTANVAAPVYFMRVLGFQNITVSAAGNATRRALVVMLVLDVSSSMNNSYNGGTACDAMQAAAVNFVSNFSAYDYLGVVSFDYSAHATYPPDTNWKTGNALANKINALNCSGNTNTTAGLHLAYTQLTGVGLPLAVNTIVLFTDGMPNGVSAAFPTRTVKDTIYGYSGGPIGCTSTGSQCLMPTCTSTSKTVSGVLIQGSGYAGTGDINGLYTDFDGEPDPSLNIPAGCSEGTALRQTLAYIPATDRFGNKITWTGANTFRNNWVFGVNNECNPNGTCAYLGGPYSSNTGVASGSNFFPAIDPNTGKAHPYASQWRLDQPTTIGAASMNAAADQAKTIRSALVGGQNYTITIHSIFLLGNGADPVDKSFLPIVSNLQQIPPLPLYEPTGTANITNPYYDSTAQTGQFLAATDKSKLNLLFAQIASSLLRISR